MSEHKNAIHTFPVPHGCTIEFAWMLYCAGVPMNSPHGEGWVNLEIDEHHEIVHVFSEEDEREARKATMAMRPAPERECLPQQNHNPLGGDAA